MQSIQTLKSKKYKETYESMRTMYANNNFLKKIFNKFSDIYVDEFFMYHVLSQNTNDIIISTVEIYLIYKELVDTNQKEFEQEFNNLNNKINSINNCDIFEKEYFKLKNIIKNRFDHDILSSPIKKLNLQILFNSNIYHISIYNTNIIKDIVLQLENNLPFNYDKIGLKYCNINLNLNYNIDFYNIKNNDIITAYTIQSS